MHFCMGGSTGFDWNRARAFLATAELGSFSAAGRKLGLSQPTVGRQVAALEQELDVVLFERVGHGLQITPTGLDLLEHVRAMSEAATKVALVAAGQSQSLAGTVCISAGQIVAAHQLPPIVADLRVRYPGIELEILATNATSDLGRREADIAIRSFRPTQPDLVARRLPDSLAHLYASPSYLASLGHPTTPAELSRGEFFGFDRGVQLRDGLNALGLSLTDASFPIVTADQTVQWELCKGGVGIAIMMQEVGDAEPLVQRALPGLTPIPIPVWLVTHRELSTSRRLRVVFDRLVEAFEGA